VCSTQTISSVCCFYKSLAVLARVERRSIADLAPLWHCPPSRNNHGAADARLNPFASTTTTNLSHFLRNVVCSYLCTGTSYCLFAPSRGQKVFFRFLRASSSIKQIVQTSLPVCIDRPHGWSLTITIHKGSFT